MRIKPAAALTALLATVAFLPGCFFGGSDEGDGVPPRQAVVPTATLPANLPEPMLVGQSAPQVTATQPPGAGGTYTVKSGDTLFAIAAQLGVPPDQQTAWAAEVLRLNGIPDASRLAAGQELRLPAMTARATATPAAVPTSAPAASATPAPTATAPAPTATSQVATPTATAPPGGAGGTYTVQAGDYPYLIAQKLGIPTSQWASWSAELIALNDISPSGLRIGQVLQLPAGTPSQ